jgi:hypothetical protein
MLTTPTDDKVRSRLLFAPRPRLEDSSVISTPLM